jgi:glycerate kinase
LIAPDKFKGTLTAKEAAEAMRRGVERAARERGITVEIDECPVADGGEGTLEAIASAVHAHRHSSTVYDWIGAPMRGTWLSHDPNRPLRDRWPTRRFLIHVTLLVVICAAWFTFLMPMQAWIFRAGFRWIHAAILAAGLAFALVLVRVVRLTRKHPIARDRTAFLEVARVLGIRAIRPRFRDPELMDTEIVGSLIGRTLEDGCGRILIGLGGTLSIDGGIGVGMLTHAFLDAKGHRPPGFGATLPKIVKVVPYPWEPRLREAELIALCDVQNPLLGPRGAARMFGPQKGATPEQVERLEKGMENLVRVCRECGIPCDPDQPGAGAAGGLGFGLATFLGAKLVPGAPFILDLLKFDERCAATDVVMTGEGKMDMQTAEGKACAEVAKRAAKAGKPCIALVGTIEDEPETLRERLADHGVRFESVHAVSEDGTATPTSSSDAAARLERATREVMIARMGAA